MLKTKIRYYHGEYGLHPVRVWKLGPLVIWRKPIKNRKNSPEALANKFGNR